MEIKTLQKDIHKYAKEKGWYEEENTPLENHMLIVSEISEATECVRNDEYYLWWKKPDGLMYKPQKKDFDSVPAEYKPEGEAVELADALLRILDYAEYNGWDMEQIIRIKMAHNETRPHKHGGKTL